MDLLKTNEKLRAAQQILKAGSWEFNITTNEVVWSEELYKIYGFDPTLPVPPYTEHMKLFTPESWEILASSVALTREQGIPYELELTAIRKDESYRWLLVRGEAVFDEKKNIIGLRGVAQDITERKQMEEADKVAIAQEQMFSKQLLENMADGFSVIDAEGRQIIVNKAFCEMTGFSEDELIGQTTPFPYWPAEELENISKTFQKTLTGNLSTFELTFQKKSGNSFPVQVSTSLLKDEYGNIINYFANVKDITEQKRKEAEINVINKEINDITNAINENSLVSVTDTKGKIIMANQKFCELSGYTETELLGQNHRIINSGYHDKKFWLNLWKTIINGKVWKGEVKNRAKDGSEYWVSSIIQPIMNDAGKVVQFLSIRHDITEQKILELEKEALIKRLNYALDASGEGIWDWIPADGKTVYSKAWLEMLGYEVGELTASTSEWSDRLHPDDAEWVFAAFNKVTQTPENGDTISHEYRFRNKAGDYLWILNKAKVVERNEKGEASRVVGTHTNITATKKENQHLKLLESVITNTKDSVLITEAEPFDEPGPKIIYVNEASQK